jgi:hypothetical protein
MRDEMMGDFDCVGAACITVGDCGKYGYTFVSPHLLPSFLVDKTTLMGVW